MNNVARWGNAMLFDVVFLGFPIALALCLAAHAIREADKRFWLPAFSFVAYSLFYLTGGRDVLLYLTCALTMMGGWASCGIGI
ncbi:MAG: hypothetical protein IPP57_04340 [Candidatus Obscuribacter sp.]|jgi:hypothetical protein|nr:hypothetical protein [Candidatus Obscuribacter sp.]MDQ5965357.1 hypothetical protein [Cyanobacteriota bacterium erpe_2018_sw_39hr_WHONDRS-SW48-000098_B_bin.30]MBK7837973.1 hypothetical protein [Candidatus Obscuribacter sp.]MBK9204745.1 hypothetical protein [Candidatus Obscuribacter sp.]MBK9770050.1 hypothetical protein [Candidatus Obscuribacter sp.]